jgi:hypothetical protein
MMDCSDKIQLQALIASTVMNIQLPQISMLLQQPRDMSKLSSLKKKYASHTVVALLQNFRGGGGMDI